MDLLNDGGAERMKPQIDEQACRSNVPLCEQNILFASLVGQVAGLTFHKQVTELKI